MRYPLRVRLFLSTPLLACLLLLPATIAQQPSAPYTSDPAFVKQRAEAVRLSHTRGSGFFAAEAWTKANKIAGGKCTECYREAADADLTIGEPKKSAEVARQWDTMAATPLEHCLAEIVLARALLQAGGGKKPNTGMLEEAHATLLKAEPLATAAYFFDGRVLSTLKRDSEAAEAFKTYAQKTRKNDPLLLRAQHLSLHPELAREQMVPAIVVDTLAGKHFNLDEMNGKVVLIDFWATWCGPCKEELPHIRQLAQKFADEPFEIISVSWDSDETKWRDFVAQNGMTWNQYRDVNMTLATAFGIHEIPHYFTIDANGVFTAENIGSGSDIEGRIRKLIKQAKEDRERIAAATDPAETGAQ